MVAPQYETRTMEMGNKYLMYATLEDGTYGDLQVITGMNTAEMSVPDAADPIRRDNQVHIQLPSAESTTIDFAVAQFPDDFREKHLGEQKVDGVWSKGGKKLPFYLVYFADVVDEFGGKSLKANMFPQATVISAKTPDTETDSETDQGFTVRIDESPLVLVNGVQQDMMKAFSSDPDGEKVIKNILENGKVYLGSGSGNTTTTTSTTTTEAK